MIPLLGVTNSDAVRTALGVSDEELNDEYIESSEVAIELQEDLADWCSLSISDLIDNFESSTPDADKLRQLRLISLYAKYFCAYTIAQAADLLFVERQGDGQNDSQRSRRTSYNDLLNRLSASMNKYRDMVNASAGDPVSSPASVFSGVIPGFDPVTYEELA